MKHLSRKEKYSIIKTVCEADAYGDSEEIVYSSIGIHNFGLLHDIASALGMKNNTGTNLRSVSARITEIMRDLIKAGYPVKEYRIKCCSWSDRETWHPLFKIEVK